ncbi:unnamed protein product [Penicillium salamii]|nr:unnamed protein product [Penicillium salamii]
MIISFGLIFFRSGSKVLGRDSAKYGKVPENDEENSSDKELVPTPSSWLPWKAVTLDTWFFEIIAIFFSLTCLMAIFSILQVRNDSWKDTEKTNIQKVYNQKAKPEFSYGITLNAIISIVGTAAKSSLLFAVGECISQLRWISLRSAPQPLFSVQVYDSASRGPLGSLQMIIRDKCRSLATLGASIIVLALAFDPFVQQIITYEIRNAEHLSDATKIKRSPFFFPDTNDLGFTTAFKAALWSATPKFEPTCPLGNCKWRQFHSVEICNRCEDVTSEARVKGCAMGADPPPVNPNNPFAKWNVSCQIVLSNGASSPNLPINASRHLVTPPSMVLTVPNDVVWLVDSMVLRYPNNTEAEVLPNSTHAGVQNPLAVFGHGVFDLDRSDSTPSWEHPEASFHIANMTKCALSFCLKTYNVSVNEGATSIEESEPDFGSFYMFSSDSKEASLHRTLCWKPSSQPIANWRAKLYGQSFLGPFTERFIDAEHSQFCGFEPEDFVESVSVSGSNSTYWSLETNRWSSGSSPNDPRRQPEFRKVVDSGLEQIMNNVALSLSNYARQISKATVAGTSGNPESYVAVKWPWITFPATLVVFAGILLVATALSSTRRKTSLWKSSVLPFLYHGLEGNLVKKAEVELMSEMDRATEKVIVRLSLSDTDNRSILRGIAQGPSSVQWRRGRRYSL